MDNAERCCCGAVIGLQPGCVVRTGEIIHERHGDPDAHCGPAGRYELRLRNKIIKKLVEALGEQKCMIENWNNVSDCTDRVAGLAGTSDTDVSCQYCRLLAEVRGG